MKLAFVYSGQGSQKVGMGKDFYESSEIFKSAFDLLSDNAKNIAFNGPIEELSKTINTQSILSAFCVGVTEMLKNEGILPCAAMGLSLGEYSALYCADVFTKQQVIDIINFRASEMTKAAKGVNCKMAAIMMKDRNIIAECCKIASEKGAVSIANLNCPGQTVISGEQEAVEFAAELCKEKGAKRVVFLQTEGAFHTPLMQSAYDALSQKFESESFNEPKIPVIMNSVAKHTQDISEIKQNLALQVKSTVNFEDSIVYLKNLGVQIVIEIGQGKALSSFIKKTISDVEVYNIEDMQSYEKTLNAIKNAQ